METEKLVRFGTGASDKGQGFIGIFLYLGILLMLFSLHGAFIFNEDLLTYRQIIALVNAFALSNIVVLGKKLRLGAPGKDAPVAFPALIKSAIFGVLFIALEIIEETALGVFHGKSVREAVPTISDSSLQEMLMTAAILFVGVIPFFALVELERVLGPEQLRAFVWGKRLKSTPGEHVERHFLNSEMVRDVVIGMADGLTVPFALAAVVSAAIASTRVVVAAGLAEIIAGAIAMGLGGQSTQIGYANFPRRRPRGRSGVLSGVAIWLTVMLLRTILRSTDKSR